MKAAYELQYIEFLKLREKYKQQVQEKDWEDHYAGEGSWDTVLVGEGHRWEIDPYAVNPEEPNRQDQTRVCSSTLWHSLYF
jgi:hypothetical protein